MERQYRSSYQVKHFGSGKGRFERWSEKNGATSTSTSNVITSAVSNIDSSRALRDDDAETKRFQEEFSKIAAKYLKKYSTTGFLTPGCLFSSTCHSVVAEGADVSNEGAATKTAGHVRNLALDAVIPKDVPIKSKLSKPSFENAPEIRDGVDGGTSKAKMRLLISRGISDLAPKAIPFGKLGGSSRRGYTLSTTKFEKLRDECLSAGKLFEDRDFPAIDANVFYSSQFQQRFEWKRPGELVSNPQFIIDGANRFDIVQGVLGDCWLLAAVADLTLNDALLTRVVPYEQGFAKSDRYCGIFYFRFWRHGQWVEVFIDDRLPTINGRLVLMHSKDKNEFWSALLEKAFAKIHGSYENLRGGSTSEALEDFTGGLAEIFELKSAPKNLFEIAQRSFELGAMMGCAADAPPGRLEAKLANGLVLGHAYSVTDIRLIEVDIGGKLSKIPCIRLRNPWGDTEWKGAFSDGSPEWKYVPENVRRRLQVSIAEDGEFWMSFDDVVKNFTKFEICNLGPETMVSADPKFVRDHPVTWEASIFSGAWTRGISAGGCRNYLDTFHLNPQYRISLREVDGPDGLAECIVALMQKGRRKLRSRGLNLLVIGFAIYAFPTDKRVSTPLNKEFFGRHNSVARVQSFVNSRQVTCRFRLPPGDYIIVPSTYDPDQEGDFLLRVYSEIPIAMAEHDHVNPAQVVQVPEDARQSVSKELERTSEINELFNQIAGKDDEIDAHELGIILKTALKTKFPFNGFSPETIRSMLTMSDVDFSGRLGLEEFTSLWSTIKQWKDTFSKHDVKNVGFIRLENLREAINSAGYLVNKHVLRVIALRYGQPDQTIQFEDFMLCVVRLQRMISIFEGKDELGLKSAIFSFDDWMLSTMYT